MILAVRVGGGGVVLGEGGTGERLGRGGRVRAWRGFIDEEEEGEEPLRGEGGLDSLPVGTEDEGGGAAAGPIIGAAAVGGDGGLAMEAGEGGFGPSRRGWSVVPLTLKSWSLIYQQELFGLW